MSNRGNCHQIRWNIKITLRASLHEGGGPQVGEVTCGALSHLSCKRDHIKLKDYMDRRVTPAKRVTSPIWGPPSPCKQALKEGINNTAETKAGRKRWTNLKIVTDWNSWTWKLVSQTVLLFVTFKKVRHYLSHQEPILYIDIETLFVSPGADNLDSWSHTKL